MPRSTREVSATDLWRAVAQIDAAAAVSPRMGAVAGRPRVLAQVWDDESVGAQKVVVTDPARPVRYALPAADLRAIRSAALTLTAARLLLAPGVVTAAVLDTTDTAGSRALLVADQLPDVDQVMVHGGRGWPTSMEARDRPTIGFAATLDEAVFGASLVIVAGLPRAGARPARLAPGALVVNATGRALPAGLFSDVDLRFVDDRALHDVAWEEPPGSLPVRADLRELGELSLGTFLDLVDPDLVTLVDLLGSDGLDLHLAQALCHSPALSAVRAPGMR
jgi:hypothetical protein